MVIPYFWCFTYLISVAIDLNSFHQFVCCTFKLSLSLFSSIISEIFIMWSLSLLLNIYHNSCITHVIINFFICIFSCIFIHVLGSPFRSNHWLRLDRCIWSKIRSSSSRRERSHEHRHQSCWHRCANVRNRWSHSRGEENTRIWFLSCIAELIFHCSKYFSSIYYHYPSPQFYLHFSAFLFFIYL